MVNFGPLTAEIGWGAPLHPWTLSRYTNHIIIIFFGGGGHPANFNWFCILAALLHGTLVVGVSQTLRR